MLAGPVSNIVKSLKRSFPETPPQHGGQGRRVLKKGMSGMDVARVQNLLNKNLAYSPPPLWVDGTFGPLTDRKVREFQSKRRLTMDGIVGADTWAALEGKPVSTPGGIGKAIAGAFPAQGFGSISKAVSSIVKDFGPGTKHFK